MDVKVAKVSLGGEGEGWFHLHTDLWQDRDVVVLQVKLLQLSTLGQRARDGRQPVVPQTKPVDAGQVAW